MTPTKFNIISSAVVMAASLSVSASPLSDYNIILSNDFNVSGGSGHVEGKSFIGGNLINGTVFAQQEVRDFSLETVKVVGNVTGNVAMHVEAGYLAYGGTTNVTNSNTWNGICHGTGISQNNACFKHITDGSLAVEKTSIWTELSSQSNYYKGLITSAGSSIFGDSNNKTFKYAGAATDLAVFNISVNDLKNINWNLDLGSAVNALINVTGDVFNAGNAKVGNFQSKANNVLWNFVDAVNLNFGDTWNGSVLALNAVINTASNLNGAVAAKSYVGNGEIHKYHFDYTPPVAPPVVIVPPVVVPPVVVPPVVVPPVVVPPVVIPPVVIEPPIVVEPPYTPPVVHVPEPSGLWLTLLGFGLIGLVRLRRRV